MKTQHYPLPVVYRIAYNATEKLTESGKPLVIDDRFIKNLQKNWGSYCFESKLKCG